MAARGRYLLITLVLLLFAGQFVAADSICDFSYSNYARAVQLHDMGDYDAALRHYRCALEADPDNGIIEILIDNVHEDIANADSAPAVVVEAPVEAPPPLLVEPEVEEIAPPVVETQPLRHSWMHSTTAIAVEREFALAYDQRTTMVLPVATFTREAGEGDVPMLSLEAIRYLRYDSLEALRIYAWSRSVAYTQMTVESIGGNTMLWLHTGQRRQAFYSRAAWKAVVISDVTEGVNAALSQALSSAGVAADSDSVYVMPGVYASVSSLRVWQRQSMAALSVRAAGQRTLESGPSSVDHLIADARAAVDQGDWEAARDSFERALELDPTRDRARCELGLVYGQLDDDRADRYQHGCWRIMSSLP
jgi:tetratricopeptide (TPR) repeat protein